MTPADAYSILTSNSAFEVGKFYGNTDRLGIGAGLFYENVRYPVFDEETHLYATTEGPVYVLTHECDVDADNVRILSEYALICPVIALADFVAEYEAEFRDENAFKSFLIELAARRVSRAVFLPAGPGSLGGGGILYLNSFASVHVSLLKDQKPSGAVSVHGLQIVDTALTNHLLRPKADRLTFGPLQ